LTPAYGLAFLVCGGLLWLQRPAAGGDACRAARWLVAARAGGVAGGDRGRLLPGPTGPGWAMSNATALTNVAVIAALAVLGALLLGESLTQIRAIGLVIAALGVWLSIGDRH
jgi:hypothetical protein